MSLKKVLAVMILEAAAYPERQPVKLMLPGGLHLAVKVGQDGVKVLVVRKGIGGKRARGEDGCS
jgi:hypothetical protein